MLKPLIGALCLRDMLPNDSLHVIEKIIPRVVFSPRDKRDNP